jgi:2-polyprenyl-3-methyl-5-hydroxy-6-metoxy-1,4-benzoquinol methylase
MSRDNFIKKYVEGKSVLDLGCLGETTNVKFSKLHDLIRENSKSCLGVDFHEKRIENLQKKGFNIVCDDVMSLDKVKIMGEKFDVIVAGELIEHLENPHLFIDNLKPLLSKNGLIILITPNIYSLRFIIRHILFGQETPYWENREDEIKFGHIIGFSKMLLTTFLLRHNLKIVSFRYIIKDEYYGFKGNLEKFIYKLFPKFSPSLGVVVKLK